MLISDIQLRTLEGYCELRAQIKSAALSDPFLLKYRFPKALETLISPGNGDPFLAALLLPAMRTGELLEICSPVSARLLRSIGQIQDIYRCWDPTLSTVVINAPIRENSPPSIIRPSQAALFFSLGVDSFYSLLKNIAEHPHDIEAITHLIVVHGFDIYFEKWNSDLYPTILANAGKVAKELGKEVLPVATNIRDFSDRLVDWGRLYHGAALVTVGLFLQGVFRKVYISATFSYADLFPWGSHPLLDPLWSTEQLSFVHDGCEAKRVDKIRFIAQYPVAMEILRVCFMNPNNEYNCGRCEKCLRTMIGLHIAGALERCKTLPHFIDVELVRNISIHSEAERGFIKQLIAALGPSEADSALRSALAECLSRCGG